MLSNLSASEVSELEIHTTDTSLSCCNFNGLTRLSSQIEFKIYPTCFIDENISYMNIKVPNHPPIKEKVRIIGIPNM